MDDIVQFSVTRIEKDKFRIVAQTMENIVHTEEVRAVEVTKDINRLLNKMIILK